MRTQTAAKRNSTITLPRRLPWQRTVRTQARRFNVVVVGRRAGKTTTAIDLVVETVLDGKPVGWFAPTYKLLMEAWREIRRTLAPVTRSANASDHRIEIVTGGVVEMWTLEDPNAGRSRKYARVIVDEAGAVNDLEARWNDAIRPTLADYAGDAWLLGTPDGMNYFEALYQRGQDDQYADWMSWQMPTMVNPYISPAEIDDMKATMPAAAFDQEILAQFLRGDGYVFRNIEACISAPVGTTPAQHAAHEKVGGLDWGQKNDFTVLSILCVTCRAEVELIRFNQIGWSVQRGRVVDAYRRWQPYTIVAESNSIGGPNIEALVEQDDLPISAFETTASSKPQIVKSFALALERAEFQWLPDPVAKAELTAYQSVINAATGRASYNAPTGKHDDTIMARMLALRAATSWGSLA